MEKADDNIKVHFWETAGENVKLVQIIQYNVQSEVILTK
jgi:hypothetical protein